MLAYKVETTDGDKIGALEAFVRVAEAISQKEKGKTISIQEIVEETGVPKKAVDTWLIVIKTIQDTVPKIDFKDGKVAVLE